MKCLASLFVIILASLPAPAQPSPDKGKPPDYYPLKVGNKWTYHVESNGADGGSISNRIAKIEKIDNEMLARLETIKDGNAVATEHISSVAKGVFRHRYNGVDFTPPICLLKLPIKDGAAWETESKGGGQKLVSKCKLSVGEVKVPAGKFKAVIVDIAGEIDGTTKVSTTYWFAPGVGVVRQTAEVANRLIVLELEKFEPGK